MKFKEEPNKLIAYVNIKKNAVKEEYQNEFNSEYNDIESYAINDKIYLKKQIDLIQPDVILCCSTFPFFKIIFDSDFDEERDRVSDRLYKLGSRWIIVFGHPSQRKSYKSNFDDLCSILTNIKI